MKTVKEVIWVILFLSGLLNAQNPAPVREPAVAGMFYPDDPKILNQTIDEYLSKADVVVEGEIAGLVSPHAGYVYSGSVAAWSYRQIRGRNYDVVVVIAPSHFEPFRGASVFGGEFYSTPLGRIPVAQDIVRQLSDISPHIQISEKGHRVSFSGRGEHSLEVQLPFLQQVLGDFRLVPIILADQNWYTVKELGEALSDVLKGKNFLIVASSDLSHYHSYNTAYKLDHELLDLFASFKYQKLVEDCEARQIEACGYGPIAAMMYACSKLGYSKSKVIKYATSGDVPLGEKTKVVGYMSGAVYK